MREYLFIFSGLLLVCTNVSAEVWRCADGTYSSSPKTGVSCSVVSASTHCINDGYRMLKAGKNAQPGVSQNCPRASKNNKQEIWSKIASNRVSYSARQNTASAEPPRSFGRRGGAQVSDATYKMVADGGNPFSGPEGIERAIDIANGKDVILPE